MSGRTNSNPNSSPVLRGRARHNSFYSSLHRVRVTDLHIERGTVEVKPISGGTPYEVVIPLAGVSIPPQLSQNDNNFARASWGVYFPQENDILIIGFDTLGFPLALGYSIIDFNVLKRRDDELDDRGGIGWADASGKRLRGGHVSFRSKDKAALYLGNRAVLSQGAQSITLESFPSNEMNIQADLIRHRYGMRGEIREGSAKRILVPGVDTQESYIPSLLNPPAPAQEYTNYVRRGAPGLPGSEALMVHESAGEVIDDNLNIPMVPATAYPDLAIALTGPFARKLTAVKDDASGLVDMYAEVIDSLGNWGVTAKTAIGFQWFTPAATWTINNNLVNWTTTTTLNITGGTNIALNAGAAFTASAGAAMSLSAGAAFTATAGATMALTATGAMTLTAPSITLASGVLNLGASPVVVTATDALTFNATDLDMIASAAMELAATGEIGINTAAKLVLLAATQADIEAPVVNLGGAAATEFLVKGTTFITELNTFMTALNTFFAAFAADPALNAVLPATKSALGALTPFGIDFQASLATALSTTSKTV